MALTIKFRKLDDRAVIPEYEFSDDSGFDLYSIEPGEITFARVTVVKTGLSVELPFLPPFTFLPEYGDVSKVSWTMEMQIRPRSGLAANEGITLVNAPGTIDHGYRGEILLLLTRVLPGTYKFSMHERLAQGILSPVFCRRAVALEEVDYLSPSSREGRGIGSTGKQ